ncbi:MAG: enoyl-CoA hydratase/isomerase family protein, partial [Acetobacteraceae bacterium]
LLPALAVALAADGIGALATYVTPLPPFSLAAARAAIDHCFAAATIPELFARLAAEDSAWARDTLADLRRASPAALFWTLRLLAEGEDRTLPQCQAAEFALSHTTMRHPDFVEGVRAMVVDKDRAPRWSPPLVEDVSEVEIGALFA